MTKAKKRLIAAATLTAAVLIVGALVVADKNTGYSPEVKRDSVELQQVNNTKYGYSFKIPEAYESRRDTVAPNNSGINVVTKNFKRSYPQGFLSVRYEEGLGKGANLLKTPLLDFVQGEIENFFPSKYKDYKSVSMIRSDIGGKSSLVHEFDYTNDGKPLRVKLIVVPYDGDSAYYFILQAHAQNYPQVVQDVDYLKDSLVIKGPLD